MLGGIGAQELILILLVILLLFGAKKIPEMAQGLGKGMREFRKAMKETQDELTKPEPPAKEKKEETKESEEKKQPPGV
jgi:sec-independent protein translocase protein TatA